MVQTDPTHPTPMPCNPVAHQQPNKKDVIVYRLFNSLIHNRKNQPNE